MNNQLTKHDQTALPRLVPFNSDLIKYVLTTTDGEYTLPQRVAENLYASLMSPNVPRYFTVVTSTGAPLLVRETTIRNLIPDMERIGKIVNSTRAALERAALGKEPSRSRTEVLQSAANMWVSRKLTDEELAYLSSDAAFERTHWTVEAERKMFA